MNAAMECWWGELTGNTDTFFKTRRSATLHFQPAIVSAVWNITRTQAVRCIN